MLAAWVIDHARLTGSTAIRDRDLDHRGMPGDLNGAPATLSARRMLDCIAREFGSDTDHIVAGRAFWQEPVQPTAQLCKLPCMTWKDPPPPHSQRCGHAALGYLSTHVFGPGKKLRDMLMPQATLCRNPANDSAAPTSSLSALTDGPSNTYLAPYRSVSLSLPMQAALAHLRPVGAGDSDNLLTGHTSSGGHAAPRRAPSPASSASPTTPTGDGAPVRRSLFKPSGERCATNRSARIRARNNAERPASPAMDRRGSPWVGVHRLNLQGDQA
jgi:hypothetical protein